MNIKDRIALSLKMRAENPNLTSQEFEYRIWEIEEHDKMQKEHYDRIRLLADHDFRKQFPFTDQLF